MLTCCPVNLSWFWKLHIYFWRAAPTYTKCLVFLRLENLIWGEESASSVWPDPPAWSMLTVSHNRSNCTLGHYAKNKIQTTNWWKQTVHNHRPVCLWTAGAYFKSCFQTLIKPFKTDKPVMLKKSHTSHFWNLFNMQSFLKTFISSCNSARFITSLSIIQQQNSKREKEQHNLGSNAGWIWLVESLSAKFVAYRAPQGTQCDTSQEICPYGLIISLFWKVWLI